MLCGCSTVRKPVRKAQRNPQGTGSIHGNVAQATNSTVRKPVRKAQPNPQGTGPIHGNVAQATNSKVRKPVRKAQPNPQGTGSIHGNVAQATNSSNDHAVVASTPSEAKKIHKVTKGLAAGKGDQHSKKVKLLPKHKIFLSHSGAQKPFVEQLCVDLESVGHFPFFDKNPDSLPKGEQFPKLIMDAASQCHVAVVVLSKKYLCSKWPMMELIEFVKAIKFSNTNLKILPLFYKIGVEDLKHEHNHVMSEWKKHCEKDKRLDLRHADEALRYLASINGEVFAGDSEVAYRRSIVASICRLYVPDVQFDVSAMQGRDRLCKVVMAKFEKLSTNGISPSSRNGAHARVVGVHGIGGAGKTLLCKALCNIYYAEFVGQVLHIELKGYKDFKQEHIIKVQKLILESLTDAGPALLRRISSVEQGNDILRKVLPRRHVFLALDNVSEGSIESVRILLNCLSPRSKAIVTTRSLENLKNVLEGDRIQNSSIDDYGWNSSSIPCEKISYIQVPFLDEDEALKIFQQHALAPARLVLPFTVEERKVLKSCIQRCFFLNKDVPVVVSKSRPLSTGPYHPLSLKALGSYLKGIDAHNPLEWRKSKILQERSRFHNDSVFDILRTGYDALPSDLDKLLFLDIAVFAPRGKLSNIHDLCDWLVSTHGMDGEQILDKMKNLRRKSLIEDWEKNKTLKVTVHDLYVEFAEHQIHLEDSRRWCVYERNGRTLPSCLKSGPSGPRWSSLVRLRLQTSSEISFPAKKLREWSNLVVLDIDLVQQKSLDLSPLNCLRSLKLKSFILETLKWSKNMEELRSVNLFCNRLVQEPDFTPCSSLRELAMRFANPAAICLVRTLASTMKVLRLTCWNQKFPAVLALGIMPSLEVVEIVNNLDCSSGSIVIEGLSSLTRLRRLTLKNLPIRGSLAGLESLVSLEDLHLGRCSGLNALPGLGKLTNLQRLDVSSTAIESLPGLKNLLQLRGLYLVNCSRLKSLPDLRPFVSLKEVFVEECTRLASLPLVPESCTVVSSLGLEEVMESWTKFFKNFCLWSQSTDNPSGPKVDFKRVLRHCPPAAALERGLCQYQGLEELGKAFEEAFLMMHRMSAAGRTKEEFDPETDLGICATIVRTIPKYAEHPAFRVAMKKYGFDFVERSSHLRTLLKRQKSHQDRVF